jgi:hypothetical protein
MPYRNKEAKRQYQREYMRVRRQVVRPDLMKPVRPDSKPIARPSLDGDGNPIYDYW